MILLLSEALEVPLRDARREGQIELRPAALPPPIAKQGRENAVPARSDRGHKLKIRAWRRKLQ
jgi:hypothetical protein